jgi:excisionase family DNA binding protein
VRPNGYDPSGSDQPVHLSAGGAPEPPLPADLHAVAAPFSTRFLPNAPIAHPPSTRRRAIGKHRRGVTLSGREDLNLRPFGPESGEGPSQGDESVTNPATLLHTNTSPQSSDSQPFAGVFQRFCYPFATQLRGHIRARWRARRAGAPAAPEGQGAELPGKTQPRPSSAPTLADLGGLWGGRDRPLKVVEVAEHLGICNATVYRLCESGELPHLRVVNSIRVRPKDLAQYVAGGAPPQS